MELPTQFAVAFQQTAEVLGQLGLVTDKAVFTGIPHFHFKKTLNSLRRLLSLHSIGYLY
jgi:hypothetical protein